MSEAAAGAVLVLWNDVTPELDEAYNDWHANEHVPERLTVPGMLWARRYAGVPGSPGPRYLTLYGLRDAQVLGSEPYQRLLREPTPMSARMRPHLCGLSRWVCQVRSARGTLAADTLVVRIFGTEDEAARCERNEAHAAPGALLLERLPDASPLPWLAGSQEEAIRGRWLLALAPGRAPAPAGGARVYTALPVNAASPIPEQRPGS
ncbi:hypothetical protein QTH89_18515 [Variovorax sp. J22G21]|uniref:DUF4286 family protein n=1 Tax=Variovorax fucosicus TaxID=3053517 RepID=UPI002578DA22|nr:MULTISPECIES: DUF4286 family protein [unclassified Variovorax]MDM0038431.1 hypothetical protein [Variovorax sp. J22R193]MDM0063207.1 hypothetical protein [Variovorax sp. J22G21]